MHILEQVIWELSTKNVHLVSNIAKFQDIKLLQQTHAYCIININITNNIIKLDIRGQLFFFFVKLTYKLLQVLSRFKLETTLFKKKKNWDKLS